MNLLMNENYYKNYFDTIHVFSPTVFKDPHWRNINIPRNQKHTNYDESIFRRLLARSFRSPGKTLFIFSDCGAENIRRGNYKNILDESQMNARW